MQLVTEGVGAHGLLQPFRFERVLRDLTMYLRQPAPDYVVATVGRFSDQKKRTRKRKAEPSGDSGPTNTRIESLPPALLLPHLRAQVNDPWSFETSAYESEKYNLTLAIAPSAEI